MPVTTETPGQGIGEIGLVFDNQETHVTPIYGEFRNEWINREPALAGRSMGLMTLRRTKPKADYRSRSS
jgi:hypothetical protein